MKHNPMFSSEDLFVQLHADESQRVDGRVLEASCQDEEAEVYAEFPESEAPAIPIGKEITLSVRAGTLRRPKEFRARVVYRWEDGHYRRYRFQLENDEARAIRTLINRRRSIRVPPDAEEPLSVRLTTADGHSLVRDAHNISANGLSIFIDGEDEQCWLDQRQVSIELELPGTDRVLEFVGSIRYRCLQGASIQIGIQFDAEATPGFHGRQERVLRYVMARYAEKMRKAG